VFPQEEKEYWIRKKWWPYIEAFISVHGRYGDFEGRFPNGKSYEEQDAVEYEYYFVIKDVFIKHLAKVRQQHPGLE
jgi:hypothetical protein